MTPNGEIQRLIETLKSFLDETSGGSEILLALEYQQSTIAELQAKLDKPAPIPTPPSDRPVGIHKAVDETRLLNFHEWNGSARYTRADRLTVWTGDTATIGFDIQDLSVSGGGKRHPMIDTFTLLIDGVKHDSVFREGATEGWFNIDTTSLADGWHVLDIVSGNETSVPYPVFVLRGNTLPEQNWMPVWTSSHEIKDYFNLVWVPTKHEPLPWPAPKREFPHFDTDLGRWGQDAFLEMLTGAVTGHARRLNVNKDGILSAATKQDYFWSDLIAKKPVIELLDGPRGANAVSMVTHIMMGDARIEDKPGSPLLNNLYATDSWRLFRVSPEGTVTTLVGYRHKSPPSNWEDEPELDLVGDWSAIPEERRGFHELWGACTDPATLEIDHSAAPIPEEHNRIPHVTGPVFFLADSQNNRICKAEFDPRSHDVPANVTEFLRLNDPWDCVEWKGKLIVSVRGHNGIVLFDMQAGEVERSIVAGNPLAVVNSLRMAKRTVSLEQVRSEDVVSPEGLYVLDDWLYYGSAAMQQVKRVHLIDGRIETIANLSGRLNFVKLAVSDGTTGPKGAVFVSAWNVGAPGVCMPDGSKWSLAPYAKNGRDRGRGGDSTGTRGFTNTSYATAVGCGHGRIVFGSAMEGLRQISKALPGDTANDLVRYDAGKQKWQKLGYSLSHGDFGESYPGLPLPWGEDVDMDYYLTDLGHVVAT